MLLPRCEEAFIPTEKLTDYLLSATHPIGRAKARFFRAKGYHLENAYALKQGLLKIACNHEVRSVVDTLFGTKYVIDGILPLTSPGKHIELRTVWIIDTGKQSPRFVTAYPLKWE